MGEEHGRWESDGQPVERGWPGVLDEVTEALESLSAALDHEHEFTELLSQVCQQVIRAVPGVDEASITLVSDNARNPQDLDDSPSVSSGGGAPRAQTAAATVEAIIALDQVQYATGDGPCLYAAKTGDVVCVAVREALERWPVFTRDATAVGYGSFLSAPLNIDEHYVGAVNCYSAAEHGFAALDAKLLELYTSAAVTALRLYRRCQHAADTTTQLRAALGNRAVIDQAKGILMALRQFSADEAFTVLVEQSQRENRKVRDIATDFVTRTTGVLSTDERPSRR